MSGKTAIRRMRAGALALCLAGLAAGTLATSSQAFVTHRLVSGPNVTVPTTGGTGAVTWSVVPLNWLPPREPKRARRMRR